jgi:hypothetical protein
MIDPIVREWSRIVRSNFASFYLTTFFAFSTILLSQGISLIDATSTSFLVLLQLGAGAICYLNLKRNDKPTILEAVVIGGPIFFAALGFVGSAWFDQNAVLVMLFVLPFLVFGRGRRFSTEKIASNSVNVEQLIALTLFGLSIINSSFVFLSIVLVAILTLGRYENRLIRNILGTRKKQKMVYWSTFYSWLLLKFLLHSSDETRLQILNPLFRGSDDLILSEQVSHSLVNFGLFDNSAAIGTEVKYHWLSLGWSGVLSELSSAAPFVVTLHVVPLVSFFIISGILLHYASNFRKERSTGMIMVLVVFGFQLVGSNIGMIEVLNVSNLLPYIWSLSLVLVLQESFRRFQMRELILISFLAFACALGKAPYAATIAVGLIWSLTFNAVKVKRISISDVLTIVAVGVPMSIAYWFFMRGEAYGSSFSFKWDQFVTALPSPLHAGNPSLLGLVSTCFTVGMIVAFVVGSLWIYSRFSDETFRFRVFVIGCTFSGLISFVLNVGGSTIYFLSSALVVFLLITPAFIGFYRVENGTVKHTALLISAVVGGVAPFVIRILLSRFEIFREFGFFSNFGIWLQILIPMFIAGICEFNYHRGNYIFSRHFIVATCGSIVLAISVTTVGRMDLPFVSTDRYVAAYAPTDEVAALDWLRENSDIKDVIVTNRMLCDGSFTCENGDVSTGSSHLISAYSERRVVIEGPRFLAASPYVNSNKYPIWISERVSDSLDFIENPSFQSFIAIKRYGSTFVYILRDDKIASEWMPWASVEFENDSVLILKLNTFING